MSQLYKGIGRTEQSETSEGPFGGANVGFGYAGSKTGDALDFGLGLVNSDNLKLLQAMGAIGGWEADHGIQLGLQGEASLFEAGGSLGDAAELLGLASNDSDMGGWQNFFSAESHALQAGVDMSMGNDGIAGGGGAELLGSSIQIGGAEYDWMFGTEYTFGAGVGGGGANFGVSWTDEDNDGVDELGLALGGGFGVGVDIAGKSEFAGRAWNFAESAADFAFGADE